jgi:hypothetical protein
MVAGSELFCHAAEPAVGSVEVHRSDPSVAAQNDRDGHETAVIASYEQVAW